MTQVKARPFIKIAGGKTQLLPELLKRVPSSYETYFEPFLGGGALFFSMQPRNAILSDSNRKLILTYKAVRDMPDTLIRYLQNIENRHRESKDQELFYYDRRDEFNGNPDALDTVILYIYLNKTCFNGIHRVNSKGKFNVPCGRYANPTICDEVNLRACSEALQGTDLLCLDFRENAEIILRKNDFVYFDPPYAPISDDSYFTSYTKEGFGPADQEALADLALTIKGRGVNVLLSNSSSPGIRKMYESRGFSVEDVLARRSINADGFDRGKIKEVLIR